MSSASSKGEVARYDCEWDADGHGAVMICYANGDYVLASDYDALLKRCQKLTEALREAWPYVPIHHGPVNARIESALRAGDQPA